MIYIPLTYTRCRPKRFCYSNTLPVFDTNSFTFYNDKNFFDIKQIKKTELLKLEKILINNKKKVTLTYDDDYITNEKHFDDKKSEITSREDMLEYLGATKPYDKEMNGKTHHISNKLHNIDKHDSIDKHDFFEKRAMPKNDDCTTHTLVKADNCRFIYSYNGFKISIFDINSSYKLKTKDRRIKKAEYLGDNVILRKSNCIYTIGKAGLNGLNFHTIDMSVCQISKEVFLLSKKGIRILSHYDSVKEDSSEEDSLEIEKIEENTFEESNEEETNDDISYVDDNEVDDTVITKYDNSTYTTTCNDVTINNDIDNENVQYGMEKDKNIDKQHNNTSAYKTNTVNDTLTDNLNTTYNSLYNNTQQKHDGCDSLQFIISKNKYKCTNTDELYVPFYKIEGEKLNYIRATEHPRQVLVATENTIFRVDLRQKDPIRVYQANTMIKDLIYKNENILVQDHQQFSLLNNMQTHPYFTMHTNNGHKIKISQNEVITHHKLKFKFYDIKSLVETRKQIYLDDYLGFDVDDSYNFFHKSGVITFRHGKWVEIEQNLLRNKIREIKTKFFGGGYDLQRNNEYKYCDVESKKYDILFNELFTKNVVTEQKNNKVKKRVTRESGF